MDPGKGEKELDTLLEQRNRLGDRLQALETREEIFKSATKSQSGKAPRKTRANPDPMLTIRQGTEFAIAQQKPSIPHGARLNRISSALTVAFQQRRITGGGSKQLSAYTYHRHAAKSRHATPLPAWVGYPAMICILRAAALR
jgi:hypothetical protein